ncbi:hypothetical protein Q9Q99_12270 [Curtobacterium flaccumfaciens]|nr:hypothetical protein Q9Q99_12270 [Curtobacterium flaccumfaciens]
MPDSTTPSELGLRDRKRIETRNRIAEAARSLVLEQGVDGTTIEQVAAPRRRVPADVLQLLREQGGRGPRAHRTRPRTRHPPGTPGIRLGEPAAQAVVDLAFLVFGSSFGDEHERLERKAVIVRFPQLMRRQVARMTTVAEAMTGAVRTILGTRPGLGAGRRDPAGGRDAPRHVHDGLAQCRSARGLRPRTGAGGGGRGDPRHGGAHRRGLRRDHERTGGTVPAGTVPPVRDVDASRTVRAS